MPAMADLSTLWSASSAWLLIDMGQARECRASRLCWRNWRCFWTPVVLFCPLPAAAPLQRRVPSGSRPWRHLSRDGEDILNASLSALGLPAPALEPRGLPPHSDLPHDSSGTSHRRPHWEALTAARSRMWSQENRAHPGVESFTVTSTSAGMSITLYLFSLTSVISRQQNCTDCQLSMISFSRLFGFTSFQT